MRRVAWFVLLCLSLPVASVVVVAWARSYFYTETLSYRWSAQPSAFRAVAASTGGGIVVLQYINKPIPDAVAWPSIVYLESNPKPKAIKNCTGFDGFTAKHLTYGWGVKVPMGWIVSVALLPVAANVMRRRRQREIARRRDSGECLACGYDLRAIAERCPECGMLTPN